MRPVGRYWDRCMNAKFAFINKSTIENMRKYDQALNDYLHAVEVASKIMHTDKDTVCKLMSEGLV